MQPKGYCKTSRVMAESQREAISLGLNSTKLNATNSLFREDPSLVFSIVTEARDQTLPGSLLARETLGTKLVNGGVVTSHAIRVTSHMRDGAECCDSSHACDSLKRRPPFLLRLGASTLSQTASFTLHMHGTSCYATFRAVSHVTSHAYCMTSHDSTIDLMKSDMISYETSSSLT